MSPGTFARSVATRTLEKQEKIFGLKLAEWLLLGMILTALASGPWADLEHASELVHFHNLVSMAMTVGSVLVAFATGRQTARKD